MVCFGFSVPSRDLLKLDNRHAHFALSEDTVAHGLTELIAL